MDNERARFVTPAYEEMPRENLKAALAHALRLAIDHQGEGLLLTFTTKTNLGNVRDLLVPIFGERGVRRLETKGRIEVDPSVQMVTERTVATLNAWDGPVLLVYPSETMLEQIGALDGVTHEVVAPFALDNHIKVWLAAWEVTPILGATCRSEAPDIDPAVHRGLEELSRFVNQGNGLVTASDRQEAIGTFETILHFRPGFTPEALHALLLGRFNWFPKTAAEACSIFADLVAGKKIRGRSGPNPARWSRWAALRNDE